MEKVYMVTKGIYSEYKVCGVFSTKEKAERFITMFQDDADYNDIEEMELNPIDKISIGRLPYIVVINKSGNIERAERANYNGFILNQGSFKETFYFLGTTENSLLAVLCLAKNKMHAIKIASEKRARILALNLWGMDEKEINKRISK